VFLRPQPQPTPYKKQLYGTLRKIVLCLLGFYAILMTTLIVVVVIYALGAISSGANLEAFLISDTPMLASVASLLGIVFGSLIMLAISGKRLFTTNLTRFKERIKLFDLFEVFVLMMGVQAVMTIIMIPFGVLGISSTPLSSPSVSIEAMGATLWGFLYIVIVGPIAEEIIFRGAIMRSLQRYGDNFAIVISALLFGLYHMFFFQGVFAFFVGILFGYVALRFSIKWSMLLHIVNNLLSTLEGFLPEQALIIIVLVEALCFIGAILILTLDRRKFKAQLLLGKPVPVSVVEGISTAGFAPVSSGYSAAFTQPYGYGIPVSVAQPYGAPVPVVQQPYDYAPQQPYGHTPQQLYGYAPQQPYGRFDKAQPFKVAFTSAPLIIAISVLGILSILTQILL